jgi:HNH endonuclease
LGVVPEGRDHIPAAVKRAVLVEAGHRCAIPTCRQTPIDIAHIVPHAESQDNSFENLIVLCLMCHRRYDAGQIDRPSMRQYKANLSLLSGRYSDLERRLIEYFVDRPEYDTIFLPGGLQLLLAYLIKDGLLEIRPKLVPAIGGSLFTSDEYHLTEAGQEFVERVRANRPLEN